MNERVQFTTKDGRFDALLYQATTAPRPGVLMIPEVFGRSRELQEMAAEFARAGFLVGLLDIHWRLEPEVRLEHHEIARARELHQRLDYQLALADIVTALEQFRAQPGCLGKVSVVGFCLGGTLAWLAAARSAADACVSYYGTRIPQYIDAAPKITHPLMLHIGGADHFTPPEVIIQIEQATKGNVNVVRHVYPGREHAFCNPSQSGFDRDDAQLAHSRTFDFLHKHLSV